MAGRSTETTFPPGTIFTVGHSTRAIENFLALLEVYAIEAVADIRTLPHSRHNPQFNAETLKAALEAAGIEYRAMPGLGGLRRPARDSLNTGWRNEGFRGFADYMQREAFARALESLMDLGVHSRTAAMCAEAVPWRCHRSLIADALIVRGVPVVEILTESSHRPHKLTPFAVAKGTNLTYPADQKSLTFT